MAAEIALDSPRGLGDAVQLRAVVMHLLERGHAVTAYSQWPDVFTDLTGVTVLPIGEPRDHSATRHFQYPLAAPLNGASSQFEAACHAAGISEPVDLRLGWAPRQTKLVRHVRLMAAKRPILFYQPSRVTPGPEQQAMRPRREAFNEFVRSRAGKYFRVRLGQAPYIDNDPQAPFDLDLFGRTSIHDAFDLGAIGDLFFGEHSFIPMLGEALDKRFVVMFSRESQGSKTFPRVRNFNPARMIHKKHLGTGVFDD